MKIFHQNQENNRKKDQRDFLPKSHFLTSLLNIYSVLGLYNPIVQLFFTASDVLR